MKHLLVIPGSPALVSELAPQDSAGFRLLDAARKQLYAMLTGTGDYDIDDIDDIDVDVEVDIDTVHIVYQQDARDFTGHAGSFRAWGGHDVVVSGGHYLPELVARYVIEPVVERARVESGHPIAIDVANSVVDIIDDDRSVAIVVADGSAGLTARAPLALLDNGQWAHQWCQQLLGAEAGSDTSTCDEARLRDAGVLNTTPWLELQSLSSVARELIDADDTLGVGRYVAQWTLETKGMSQA